MNSIQDQFIDFALSQNILQFGDFTLKSGRQSPYFFNAGLFYTGAQLAKLGQFYAKTLQDAGIEFDILFGPAYKGLPLATTTAVALNSLGQDIEVSFNRKEAKQHGEKGQLIGAPLKGKKIIMIDDVITAGTAYRETKQLIAKEGGILSGVIIALNRQEKGANEISAIDEIKLQDNIPVLNIICLDDILNYLKSNNKTNQFELIQKYQTQWCSKD